MDSEHYQKLEQVRTALMGLDGQQAFRGADDLSAEVIDMAEMLAPLDEVIAWGRMNWLYGMSREEAQIIMRHWRTGDGYSIDSLDQLGEVVRIARAIKAAFPARSLNQCAQRAARIGSMHHLNLDALDQELSEERRAEAVSIQMAVK